MSHFRFYLNKLIILLVPYLVGVGSGRTNKNVFFSEKMLETCVVAIPPVGVAECTSFPVSVQFRTVDNGVPIFNTSYYTIALWQNILHMLRASIATFDTPPSS